MVSGAVLTASRHHTGRNFRQRRVHGGAELAAALSGLRTGEDLEQRWIEIHRLENEGDRVWREALASLFSDGIDPMVVIRWKDIFGVLERAIDATETAAHHIESIVVKRS